MNALRQMDWTEDEAGQVRAALTAAQRGMTVGPPPVLDRGPHRKFGRVPLLVAAAVAVTLLVVTLVTAPWRTRAEIPAGFYDPPVQLDPDARPVEDPAWRAAAAEQLATTSGALTGVTPADVRVVLAFDVAGARLALARWPESGGAMQGWLIGPEGAPARGMYVNATCPGALLCWTRYGEDPGSRSQGVVAAATGSTQLSVRTGNDVTAAGAVRRAGTAADQPWTGIFVAPLTEAGGHVEVVATGPDGHERTEWTYTGYTDGLDEAWTTAARAARGPGVGPGTTVRGDLASAVQRVTAMPFARGSRVLWATHQGGTDRAVLAIRGDSGGRVLAAVERTQVDDSTVDVPVAALRPVAADDPLALAYHRPGSPDRIGLLGPDGAVAARVDGGRPIDLDDGAADVTAPDAARVTFLAGDGAVLATVPVSPAWKDGAVLQASPPT